MKTEKAIYTCDNCKKEVVVQNNAYSVLPLSKWYVVNKHSEGPYHICCAKCLGEWANKEND